MVLPYAARWSGKSLRNTTAYLACIYVFFFLRRIPNEFYVLNRSLSFAMVMRYSRIVLIKSDGRRVRGTVRRNLEYLLFISGRFSFYLHFFFLTSVIRV